MSLDLLIQKAQGTSDISQVFWLTNILSVWGDILSDQFLSQVLFTIMN